MIAYPNFQGLAEWEPARSVANGSYVFADINTDRFDVIASLFSIWILKIQSCGGLTNN